LSSFMGFLSRHKGLILPPKPLRDKDGGASGPGAGRLSRPEVRAPDPRRRDAAAEGRAPPRGDGGALASGVG